MTRRGSAICSILAALIGLGALASLAPAEPPSEAELRSRWSALYKRRAEALRVSLAESKGQTIKLLDTALLTYTNPVRAGRTEGSVFLWTEEGRPVLAAAFWSVNDESDSSLRRLSREWHSLSQEEMTVNLDSARVWRSGEPGIEWHNLVDTAAPTKSRTLRLVEMRKIVAGVQATIGTGESELRLMPQPLYRYPESTPGVLDGAMFAFVMGTDPELFAIVEAIPRKKAPQWRIGFVPFTNAPVEAHLNGVKLFTVERCLPGQSTGPHHLGITVERHPADLSDEIVLPAEETPQ
jgi:hypothetical protein